MYAHVWKRGESLSLPVGKVVCIGRNYVEHAKELDNPIPDEPVLFLKPQTSLVGAEDALELSDKLAPIHYEAELSILIGKALTKASEKEAVDAIAGIGVALDLTRRETQSALKAKGLPWELAKAFDGSCVQSPFIPLEHDLTAIRYGLDINDDAKQRGDTSMMITPVAALLSHVSQYFTLLPGDIVLTGTPKGVGQLHGGDALTLTLEGETLATFSCVSVP
ncbi:fumarylacetoacetate hydrolase family protein [Enterovibrio coralii]|uniref:5-carboxymethyl-2-hydroxymuconate delta-isomerase n=1 Tax=Enterovibrio coralii TaxID=294935 RepID=A0A135IAA9_9GAMM|nr:fumarylacetoacetate hydrolase family protein [Enterovibrio coralii]KXF82372.1 5-carboxymethyl-2-hydroxymuconate delta-isomerase [Enterovibrio coralii]